MKKARRGDVYYVELNSGKGSEQGGGVRPILIIQNDMGNNFSPTFIVAPITSRDKPTLPTHIALKDTDFLRKNSMVLLEQIITIDRSRFKSYIGHIDIISMAKVDVALAISVGLNKAYCVCA